MRYQGISDQALVKKGFEILDFKEMYEEPVTLYFVSTRKT